MVEKFAPTHRSVMDYTPATKSRDFDARQGGDQRRATKSQVWHRSTCIVNTTGYVTTHNSRTDGRRTFKLGGRTKYIFRCYQL